MNKVLWLRCKQNFFQDQDQNQDLHMSSAHFVKDSKNNAPSIINIINSINYKMFFNEYTNQYVAVFCE